jgi:hypothetical protein
MEVNMELKPGMLCLIVGGPTMRPEAKEHVGKVVGLLTLVPTAQGSKGWHTNPTLPCKTVSGSHWIWNPDHLKPLKDDDGVDEMIHIAGKPTDIQWLNVCNHL